MERSAWTDERLDDLAATVDRNFGLLRGDIRGVREELGALREDTHAEFGALRADLSAWQRQIAQIGWALATALIVALVALLVAVL
jgi:hypothetical protein